MLLYFPKLLGYDNVYLYEKNESIVLVLPNSKINWSNIKLN